MEKRIKSFKEDQALLNELNRELHSNLRELEQKYGIKMYYGTIRYGDGIFTTSLTATIPITDKEKLISELRVGDVYKERNKNYTIHELYLEDDYVIAIRKGNRYRVTLKQIMSMVNIVRATPTGSMNKQDRVFHMEDQSPLPDYLTDMTKPVTSGGKLVIDDIPREGKTYLINGKKVHEDDIETL